MDFVKDNDSDLMNKMRPIGYVGNERNGYIFEFPMSMGEDIFEYLGCITSQNPCLLAT